MDNTESVVKANEKGMRNIRNRMIRYGPQTNFFRGKNMNKRDKFWRNREGKILKRKSDLLRIFVGSKRVFFGHSVKSKVRPFFVNNMIRVRMP